MTVILEQFVQSLRESGLMTAQEIDVFLSSLPPEEKPTTGEELAKALHRHHKLTKFQAQAVYQGKTKGLVVGNYVVLDKIGEGGMGHVYKAEHRRMKRIVALKMLPLPAHVAKSPESVRRFQQEVEAAATLSHPNIVMAYDADEANGVHFLVMEYVEGQDLAALVRERGPLPVSKALDYVLQAAKGLEYAHRMKVIHRDIKPSNLLLDARETVKILDMGLARFQREAGPEGSAAAASLTQNGQMMGTIDYMSPEQALDTHGADERSDIYSLGCTLFYLLLGRAVYAGDALMRKVLSHREEPIPSLCALRGGVPEPLDQVFQKMVAKRPEERYRSMGEVIAALEQCRSGTAAEVPAVRTAVQEDAQSDEFLRGTAATSRQRPVPPRQPAPAAASARAPVATPVDARVSDPDATVDEAAPQVATDPKTEQPLSGGRIVSPAAKKARSPPRPPWWQDRRGLAAAGAGGLLLILLGIWVIFRDKNGNEVARVGLPEAGSVTQEREGTAPSPGAPAAKPVPAASQPLPLPPWNLPPGSPPPAIAPFDAARAKEHQGAWAKHLGVPVESENSIGMRFVLIPPGEFDMGSTEEEVARLLAEAKAKKLPIWYIDKLPSEAPKHRVRITKPFGLSRCEVTRGQFRRFVDDRGYRTEAERDGKGAFGLVNGQWVQHPRFVWNADLGIQQTDDYPVVNVSWNDVTAFCEWLSEKEGVKCHLPAEVQWEYACRAGTTTSWHFGDNETALREHAWFAANSGGMPHAVGQLRPNAWGLYDIHGNVFEWCQDWWRDGYYAMSPMDDPTGPPRGWYRVPRGGGWKGDASMCRASYRSWDGPDRRIGDLGFRLAKIVSQDSSRVNTQR